MSVALPEQLKYSGFRSMLSKPVNGFYLYVFRIVFSLLMAWQFSSHFVRAADYDQSGVLKFYYPGLSWIPQFTGDQLRIILTLGIIAALLAASGILFRWAIGLVFFLSTWIQLSDALYYNNHYYYFALLCLLLSFTDAGKGISLPLLLDRKRKESGQVPYWQIFILQLMVLIVYFYGGLAKLNTDWLEGNITRFMYPDIHSQNLAWLIAWGGMFFDLFIGFLLFWPRTRWWAIGAVILFNLTNGLIFFNDIHIFPLAMVFASLLFIPGIWWKNLSRKLFDKGKKRATGSSKNRRVKASYAPIKAGGLIPPAPFIKWTLVLFFGFQFLWPLRHYLIPGNTDWTGQGHYMAWRMKSYHKAVSLSFSSYDRKTGALIKDYGNLGLSEEAEERIGAFPFFVWQMAQEIKRQLTDNGEAPEVRVNYSVEFNGRPLSPAIDPKADLGNIQYSAWTKNAWIPTVPSRQ